jgi:hypothetical protein
VVLMCRATVPALAVADHDQIITHVTVSQDTYLTGRSVIVSPSMHQIGEKANRLSGGSPNAEFHHDRDVAFEFGNRANADGTPSRGETDSARVSYLLLRHANEGRQAVCKARLPNAYRRHPAEATAEPGLESASKFIALAAVAATTDCWVGKSAAGFRRPTQSEREGLRGRCRTDDVAARNGLRATA